MISQEKCIPALKLLQSCLFNNDKEIGKIISDIHNLEKHTVKEVNITDTKREYWRWYDLSLEKK